MIDFFRRLFGYYDSSGLKYSTDHLRNIADEIAFWPIDKQAEYADQICIERLDTETVLRGFDFDPHNYRDAEYAMWNATSVGNCAYIALNSRYENVRQRARTALEVYREFRKQKHPTNK